VGEIVARIAIEHILAEMSPSVATAYAMVGGLAGWDRHTPADVAKKLDVPTPVIDGWLARGHSSYMQALERLRARKARERGRERE